MDHKINFVQLCLNQKLTDSPFDIISVYQGILHHYATVGRYYHNLIHIHRCLQECNQISHLIPDPDAVQMALWFHDVIYVPGQHDNEEKSAAYFLELAKNAFKSDFKEKVVRLIMATTHRKLSTDLDECFITDIDLSGFGSSWDNFFMDSKLLRQERMDLPIAAYNQANSLFLQHLLARERIFQTDFFYNRFEATAVNNIKRLLKLRESEE